MDYDGLVLRVEQVLIDTWWNVNDKHQYMDEEVHSVLIDTWWNVNMGDKEEVSRVYQCFNRYMVECE